MLLCQFYINIYLVYNTVVFFLLLFPPYLRCIQNNLPENNVEPVPAKSESVQLCGCVVFFVVVPAKSELPPKLLVVRLAGCAVVSVFGSGGK